MSDQCPHAPLPVAPNVHECALCGCRWSYDPDGNAYTEATEMPPDLVDKLDAMLGQIKYDREQLDSLDRLVWVNGEWIDQAEFARRYVK